MFFREPRRLHIARLLHISDDGYHRFHDGNWTYGLLILL
jgi:hypothetical protein